MAVSGRQIIHRGPFSIAYGIHRFEGNQAAAVVAPCYYIKYNISLIIAHAGIVVIFNAQYIVRHKGCKFGARSRYAVDSESDRAAGG